MEHGRFINRGFLNGPYCPIYGFGVIIVTGALDPIKGNAVVLYIGAVVLTSLLELFTGFLLEKIFNMHWWDYSGERFNLHGYICLKFSLLWGVACLVVVRVIHPAVSIFVDRFPHTLGIIIMSLFMAGFASDMVITVLAIVHFKKRLRLLEEISGRMRKLSDMTGEKIFSTVEGVMDRKEELDEKAEDMRKRYEELREKYRAALSKRELNIRRIEKAFPKLRFSDGRSFKEQLEELRKNLKK